MGRGVEQRFTTGMVVQDRYGRGPNDGLAAPPRLGDSPAQFLQWLDGESTESDCFGAYLVLSTAGRALSLSIKESIDLFGFGKDCTGTVH